MNARRSEGKAVLGLAALLAVLVAAGGGNYVRNMKAEEASEAQRPFHSYELDDLTALRAAYEAEVASLQRRYDAARAGRKRGGSHAMMDEAVADFERVRAQSDGLRELGTQIAEREARIRDIDAELAARNEIGEGWDAHLRRLTRI